MSRTCPCFYATAIEFLSILLLDMYFDWITFRNKERLRAYLVKVIVSGLDVEGVVSRSLFPSAVAGSRRAGSAIVVEHRRVPVRLWFFSWKTKLLLLLSQRQVYLAVYNNQLPKFSR